MISGLCHEHSFWKIFVEANLNLCCFVFVPFVLFFFYIYTVSVWKATGPCNEALHPLTFSSSILICSCMVFFLSLNYLYIPSVKSH